MKQTFIAALLWFIVSLLAVMGLVGLFKISVGAALGIVLVLWIVIFTFAAVMQFLKAALS